MLRQRGLLSLVGHLYKWLRWKSITLKIRKVYFASQRKQRALRSVPDEPAFTEEIASYGLQAISQVKKKFANLYSERKDVSFLINTPTEAGAQAFYLLDLAQCLQYAGLKVHCYKASAEKLEKVLSDCHPSVFLTSDWPLGRGQAQSDLLSLKRYKKQYGLARLYIPRYLSPLRVRKASLSDVEHIALHQKGELADAFFGYFEEIFWDVFCKPWKGTGLNYYSIPFAANPLRHYPVRVTKDLVWGIATANSDLGERAALTYKYMRQIICRYKGAIAGHNWGKGIDSIPTNQIAQFFSRVWISPNIACESNVRYPVDCGAKVHELSAMGVFQLTSETEALRKYYSAEEIVGFRNPDDFKDLFDYFVDKPQLRYVHTRSAMVRTLGVHTYFHRIGRLIEVLDQHPELFCKGTH